MFDMIYLYWELMVLFGVHPIQKKIVSTLDEQAINIVKQAILKLLNRRHSTGILRHWLMQSIVFMIGSVNCRNTELSVEL